MNVTLNPRPDLLAKHPLIPVGLSLKVELTFTGNTPATVNGGFLQRKYYNGSRSKYTTDLYMVKGGCYPTAKAHGEYELKYWKNPDDDWPIVVPLLAVIENGGYVWVVQPFINATTGGEGRDRVRAFYERHKLRDFYDEQFGTTNEGLLAIWDYGAPVGGP